MELHVLNSNFQRDHVIDKFLSVIWTERYTHAGDVTLVVAPTNEMATRLKPGTFLAIPDSQEVMLLDTALIEDGQLKVTGNTLSKFLDERINQYSNDIEEPPQWGNWVTKPSAAMRALVSDTVVEDPQPGYTDFQSYWPIEQSGMHPTTQWIPGLEIDNSDPGVYAADPNPERPITLPRGPIYTTLEELGTKHNIGFSLYLYSVGEYDYVLKFKVYLGRDRTSDNPDGNPLVRFSPALDSLSKVKDLQSIAVYRNVAYAYPSNDVNGLAIVSAGPPVEYLLPGVAYADASSEASRGFDRRVMRVTADLTSDLVGGTLAGLEAALLQVAKDALANNNYIKMVDGEIVPQNQYSFGIDYFMGDIIELEGRDGNLQKARVTEYIRSQDANGERKYPTISIIE